ncbi:MAG TPA: hypothetical protein VGB43_02990 [Flavobacterium sp.]
MKKIQLAAMAIIALLTFSCSDDNDNPTPVPVNDDTYIEFKINGTQVNMDEPGTITSLMASISATKDEGADIRAIVLTIPVDATEGTHTITDASPSDLTAYSAHYSMGDVSFNASSGTMVISDIGAEYMEGTFTFTGEYEGVTYNVTEGKFSAYKPNND